MPRRQPRFDVASARRRVLEAALQEANYQTRQQCPSRALRRAQRVVRDSDTKGGVLYPHYWAVPLHEGRRELNARPGKKLVYFANPDDDPRIKPRPFGYPERVSQRRRLTKAEFRAGLRKNRSRAPGDPYMLVRTRVGASRPQPWLRVGMKGNPERAIMEATYRALDREVARQFPPRTARIRAQVSIS